MHRRVIPSRIAFQGICVLGGAGLSRFFFAAPVLSAKALCREHLETEISKNSKISSFEAKILVRISGFVSRTFCSQDLSVRNIAISPSLRLKLQKFRTLLFGSCSSFPFKNSSPLTPLGLVASRSAVALTLHVAQRMAGQ